MKKLIWAVAAAGLFSALPAAAQFAKPEDAIKYRRSAMFLMSQHFGRVGAMANGKMPFDAKAAAENADLAAMLSKLPFAGFVPGSDKGETKAKPEVWTENDKFHSAANKMQEEMAKLDTAAKTGDLAQIKAAFGPVGKACKDCHDNFREK